MTWHLTGSLLRKEGLLLSLSLRVQSILVRKAWWQEQEAAAHSAFTVFENKEKKNTSAPVTWVFSAQDLHQGVTVGHHDCGQGVLP